jgi:hypothetical protein
MYQTTRAARKPASIADILANTEHQQYRHLDLQARYLVRACGISPHRARVLAEIAFPNGGDQ